MKVLVTAATKHGATGEIAQGIGEALRERGLDPTVLEPERVDGVDGYDAVVLGSAVYAGHWLKPARELVARCGDALAARPMWNGVAGSSAHRVARSPAPSRSTRWRIAARLRPASGSAAPWRCRPPTR